MIPHPYSSIPSHARPALVGQRLQASQRPSSGPVNVHLVLGRIVDGLRYRSAAEKRLGLGFALTEAQEASRVFDPGEGFCGRNQVCTHLVSPSRRSGPSKCTRQSGDNGCHVSTVFPWTPAQPIGPSQIVVRRNTGNATWHFINCSFIANNRYKVTQTGDVR